VSSQWEPPEIRPKHRHNTSAVGRRAVPSHNITARSYGGRVRRALLLDWLTNIARQLMSFLVTQADDPAIITLLYAPLLMRIRNRDNGLGIRFQCTIIVQTLTPKLSGL
jgi:hypothetical protein